MILSPPTLIFVIIFFFILLMFFVMSRIDVIALAFTKIGIPSQYGFTASGASVVVNFVNIPIKRILHMSMAEIPSFLYSGFEEEGNPFGRQPLKHFTRGCKMETKTSLFFHLTNPVCSLFWMLLIFMIVFRWIDSAR